MTRKTYTSFRQKELDGGLNLENSPNEIENKQALKCLNFNFDGNKLVNSNSSSQYGSSIFDGEIKGIDVIDQRLYITYQNAVTGKIDIMQGYEGVWRNALGNINSFFYYIPSAVSAGQTYSITLTGIDFSETRTATYTTSSGDTALTVYNSLLSQINGGNAYYYSEVGEVVLGGQTSPTIGLLIGVFGKNRASASESGNGELVNGVVPTTVFNSELFKSGDDLFLISNSISPIYYKAFGPEGNNRKYFGVSVNGIGRAAMGTYYNGKVILATGEDNLLYFSKTSSATQPYLVSQFGGYDGGVQRVGGDGKITGIITGENGLYVFKEDEIYYSNSISDDGTGFVFILNRITNNGAKDQYCIARGGQELFYYDGLNKKVRRLSYEQNLTTLRDTGVSGEVDELFNSQPEIFGIQQKMFYSYPNLYISTRTNGELLGNNNVTYVYNVDRKSWSVENFAVKHAYGKYFSKPGINNIYQIDENEYCSDGEWISKEFDFGDAMDYKRFGEVEVYGKNTDEISIFIDVYIDDILERTDQVQNNFGEYFRHRIDLFNEGRIIKVGIRYEGEGPIEINELNIKYKPILAYNEYN